MPIKINNKTDVNQISLGQIVLIEDSGEGTNSVSIKSPESLTSSVNLVLPDSAGDPGQLLTTDGEGNLSWGISTTGVTSVTAGDGISVDNSAGDVIISASVSLEMLTDTQITSKQDGEFLKYVSSSNKWVNSNIVDGGNF